MARRLSPQFMTALKNRTGMLHELLGLVRRDRDLVLEIREDEITVYCKGQRLLNLAAKNARYKLAAHKKFAEPLGGLRFLTSSQDTAALVQAVPQMKQRIAELRVGANELECEQMLIRANNLEPGLNTEYFIIDRQVVKPPTSGANAPRQSERPDLLGIHWPIEKRKRKQEVPLALIEAKFSHQNQDIRTVHEQLEGYYHAVSADVQSIAAEATELLHQKLDLGLLNQPAERLEALRTLTIKDRIQDVLFVIVMFDFPPRSVKLDYDKIRSLPFADQVRIFHSGFGLWDAYQRPLASST